MVTVKKRDALEQRVAIAEARCDALRRVLRAVLATIPNEFASAEVQAIRREARCVAEET